MTTTLPVFTTTTAPSVPTPFALAIEPAAIAFDAQTVGVASPTQAARVRNTGTGSNTVGAVSIGGTNAADFAVVSTNCVGAVLAPGATCDVEVGFTPTDAGAESAQLTATGQGGSSAAATLTSAALYAPRLKAFPPVAAPGQVTTLIGEGFPPSTPDPDGVGGRTRGVHGHERRDRSLQAPGAHPREHPARTADRVGGGATWPVRAGRRRPPHRRRDDPAAGHGRVRAARHKPRVARG